jgi:hypothetical protein
VVLGFQTEVTFFPQRVASALAQTSPFTGKVIATVLVVKAVPRDRTFAESFVAIIPRSVPAPGFNFLVPARATSRGTFTVRSKAIVVEEERGFRLSLTVGSSASADLRPFLHSLYQCYEGLRTGPTLGRYKGAALGRGDHPRNSPGPIMTGSGRET